MSQPQEGRGRRCSGQRPLWEGESCGLWGRELGGEVAGLETRGSRCSGSRARARELGPSTTRLGEGSESRAGREDGRMPADRARGWGPAAGVGRGEGGVVWTRGVYSPALGH